MADNNLVITDLYNLKMAVINSDVFCSFRFIDFENGSQSVPYKGFMHLFL